MVARAASWLAGVTPAHSLASTRIGTSGSMALISSALLTTQMSVHSPTSSIESMGRSAFLSTSHAASSAEPKVGLSKTGAPSPSATSATAGASSQPAVPRTQWVTGRFLPSCVCR